MGLFDFFKKKDGAYFLNHARKALTLKHWVEARDDAHEALALPSLSPELEAGLREVLKEANLGICEMNLVEAEHCRKAGDFNRTLECLETARLHTSDETVLATISTRVNAAKEEKARANQKVTIRSAHEYEGLKDEEEIRTMEEFEVYLAGLEEDVATRYRQRGYTFAQAYVAMNAGDSRKSLQFFANLKPRNDEDAALLGFEQARALLMAGRPDRALQLLDVTAAIRGSAPIFLSNHPSVAYLRYEALLGLNRPNEAVEALEQGLKVHPRQMEMRNALANILIAMGQLEEAETVVNESTLLSKTDGEVYVLRGKLLGLKNQHAEAIQVLEGGMRAVNNTPTQLNNANVSRALVEAYLDHQSEMKRVQALLGQIFDAQDGEGDWIDYYLQARLQKWQGDENAARESIKKAMTFVPDTKDPRRAMLQAVVGK